MIHIGIDPGQRNLGICVLSGALPRIKLFTNLRSSKPILESAIHLEESLRKILQNVMREEGRLEAQVSVTIERQLSGGYTSPLMFYMQMKILEIVRKELPKATLIMPFPVQLRSFMLKILKFQGISTKRAVVHQVKERTGWGSRLSSHEADAYCLAKLGEACLEGNFSFAKPSREFSLCEKELFYGN